MRFFITILLVALSSHIGYSQCKDLRKWTDKFDGSITIRSPFYRGPNHEPVFVTRRKSKGKISFFMNFAVWASASANGKGVYLLLANGQKLEWPDEKVTIDYSTRFFANSSVLLSLDQLDLLMKIPITDIRLDYFDKTISRKEGERFSAYLKCLTTVSDEEVKEQKVL